jgi:hypothetical protein
VRCEANLKYRNHARSKMINTAMTIADCLDATVSLVITLLRNCGCLAHDPDLVCRVPSAMIPGIDLKSTFS